MKKTSIRANIKASLTFDAIHNKKFYGNMQQQVCVVFSTTYEKFENVPIAPSGIAFSLKTSKGDTLNVEIPRYSFSFYDEQNICDTDYKVFNCSFCISERIISVEAFFLQCGLIDYIIVTEYDDIGAYDEGQPTMEIRLSNKEIDALTQDENVEQVANDGYCFAFIICKTFNDKEIEKEYKKINLCSKTYCKQIMCEEAKKWDSLFLVQSSTEKEMIEKLNDYVRRDIEAGVKTSISTYAKEPYVAPVYLLKVEYDTTELRATVYPPKHPNEVDKIEKKATEELKPNIKVYFYKCTKEEDVEKILSELDKTAKNQGKRLWTSLG